MAVEACLKLARMHLTAHSTANLYTVSTHVLSAFVSLANYYPHSTCCRCVSIHLSVTRRHCTKTAKHRIRQTTPYDNLETLVFWCRRSQQNSNGVTSKRNSTWYKSSQYPFHLSVIYAASVKLSSVADWIHCRNGWKFRFLTIWKSCLEFSFEFAASYSMHMPSSCCCLSTLSFLCTLAFSSWYRFLSLPFASIFSLIAA